MTQRAKELLLPELEEETMVALPATFTYSVKWEENKAISFKDRTRFNRNFFPTSLEVRIASSRGRCR